MRLVVQAEDDEEALHEGDARVAILDAGRATLEIANPAQKRMIDEVEVGRHVAPKMRVAFEVLDSAATTDALVSAGAALIAAPTETPWRSQLTTLRPRRTADHPLPGARARLSAASGAARLERASAPSRPVRIAFREWRAGVASREREACRAVRRAAARS
jgi:hypothetical protein